MTRSQSPHATNPRSSADGGSPATDHPLVVRKNSDLAALPAITAAPKLSVVEGMIRVWRKLLA